MSYLITTRQGRELTLCEAHLIFNGYPYGMDFIIFRTMNGHIIRGEYQGTPEDLQMVFDSATEGELHSAQNQQILYHPRLVSDREILQIDGVPPRVFRDVVPVKRVVRGDLEKVLYLTHSRQVIEKMIDNSSPFANQGVGFRIVPCVELNTGEF